MRQSIILISGVNGEIGHGLVSSLYNQGIRNLIGIDLSTPDDFVQERTLDCLIGNILDHNLLDRINAQYQIEAIYHMAALLSTRAEFSPVIAHEVNVDGTLNLLDLAMEQAQSHGQSVKFFFPSSIAVYGIPTLEEKSSVGAISEDDYRHPQTMYGCNKLYCESLGDYYSHYYKRLSTTDTAGLVDFRSIRFPGIISAHTLPAGGTSDYAPEMIHAAAKGEHYSCFVREDATIPFMTMSDAIVAIEMLMAAPKDALTKMVYNVKAFNPSAGEFLSKVKSYYPEANIDFIIHDNRQSIIDSWPEDINDDQARADWGWSANHDLDKAFSEYLMPVIRSRYEHN
ncbi:MAG: NAD-dependent epimerase/dehydratase family protein [FCB group bacterium]|nr:NAD-dependent epimerase/dehydratase family protein [FCB group bacterium]MBL7027973.1 NAD-dependent epimerase/dehydratase family protein [Candidatus Neomarinimicrobiota bacterium]MBL7122888.1 NAD-dependent epimerase/dehydratase family protein [Candidatus Neomarinimicrobiota bacterium]